MFWFLLGCFVLMSLEIRAYAGIETAELEEMIRRAADMSAEKPKNIEEMAAELAGKDEALDFVKERIRPLHYEGLLQGALGTLVSSAGNELDRYELLFALLESQGHSVRYARQRIEGKDHYWIQVLEDDVWKDMFLSEGRAPVAGVRINTSDSLPDKLKHSVRLRVWIKVKTGPSWRKFNPLDVTVSVPDIYGKQITLFNRFRGSEEEEKYIIEALQPVLTVGEQEIPGKPFPEAESDEPVQPANRMTGVFDMLNSGQADEDQSGEKVEVSSEWVDVSVHSPGADVMREKIVIFDLQASGGEVPDSLNGLLTTAAFGFSPARLPKTAVQQLLLSENEALSEFISTLKRVSGFGNAMPEEQELERMNENMEKAQRILTRLVLETFVAESDDTLEKAEAEHADLAAYFKKPRIIISTAGFRKDRLRYRLDLRYDRVSFTASDGKPHELSEDMQFNRGLYESRLEGEVLRSFTGKAGITAGEVIDRALAREIPVWFVIQETRSDLKACSLDRDSRNSINRSLREGRAVIVPERPVEIDGRNIMAWYEYDPETGLIAGVFPDGSHGAMTEYILENVVVNKTVAQGMSYFSSMVVGYYFSIAMGLGHFYACLLDIENPDRKCFGSSDVCHPALSDAMFFCNAWKWLQKKKGEIQGDIGDIQTIAQGKWMDLLKGKAAGLIPWPNLWEKLAGEPCERGAKYGLRWFGCRGVLESE